MRVVLPLRDIDCFSLHINQALVTVIISFILLVVKILYLIDWVVVLQLTGIEG